MLSLQDRSNDLSSDLFHPILPSQDKPAIIWHGLAGASVSVALSAAIQAKKASMICIVVENNLMMEQLFEELHFFCPKTVRLSVFPHWETLPYDHFSPHHDLIASRLTVLDQLEMRAIDVVISTSTTLHHRLPPRSYLQERTFLLKVGDDFSIETWRNHLINIGYRAVTEVQEHGEYAVRGAILDLFPTDSVLPFRIDLLDNSIDSIRTFSTETQRTIKKINAIQLLPAKEFPFSEEAIDYFRMRWRSEFSGNPLNSLLYQDLSEGICPPGIEYYFPLFFEKTATFFDYLPQDTHMVFVGNPKQCAKEYWQDIQHRYEQNRDNTTRPLLDPHQLFIDPKDAESYFERYLTLSIISDTANIFQHHSFNPSVETPQSPLPVYHFGTNLVPSFLMHHHANEPLTDLQQFIEKTSGRLLFCTESIGRREMVLQLLASISIHPVAYDSWHDFLSDDTPYGIVIAALEEGFCISSEGRVPLTVMTESQIYGKRIMQRRLRKTTKPREDAFINNLSMLQVGDLITHVNHGIGRYCGLKTLNAGDTIAEYVCLEYANEDKLYVPIASLHCITRYLSANTEAPPLHKLGNSQWQHATRKAIEKVQDVAAELLELYAKRAINTGYAYHVPSKEYEIFVAEFPFEETPDQLQAISDVLNDMQAKKPMDRVICGEVGFGKTEVAMRAAFVAVQNNQQVAILVPTTLLAQQHYKNFQDRFANWPVQIGSLSRFNAAKERTKTLEQLKKGQIDIVIGTHQLLQPSIQFKCLGLVIIDEEHRFGVKQKELLKTMRTSIDMLTMTATPIPRTLNMAFAGMRDLSIIATPPARRLSVKTFLQEYHESIIQEAIRREIMRGGQVYFLHNDIDSMRKQADQITKLVSEARVSIAHGQMPERELENIMADFYHRRFNVLVCSTIIESGIDVPTANTILINRADRFGLAQLHQLRGRVGRSHHQAYAYLLIPSRQLLTRDASKRLEAISALDTLGVGFTLATHDLEIRGAGELLGDKQSGEIKKLGFTLYMELLSKAIAALKAGQDIDLEKALIHRNAEIHLHIPALIPETYIQDVPLRLTFYKRISNASSSQELDEIQVELTDRFGLLPEALKHLIAINELALKAQFIGILKIDANEKEGKFIFSDRPNIDPKRIMHLIQTAQHGFKMLAPHGLRFALAAHNRPMERIALVMERLNALLSSE